jgi:hypothetical protein
VAGQEEAHELRGALHQLECRAEIGAIIQRTKLAERA